MGNTFIVKAEAQSCFDLIIGTSQKMQFAISLAKKAALHNLPVLISGEKGAGKKFFGKAIHYAVNQNPGDFIKFNCTDSSEEALQNILDKNKPAYFTLFLKNADALSVEQQEMLLYFLESSELNKSKSPQIRIITSLKTDVKQLVIEKKFSKELYHKFHFDIALPSLRERKEDIPHLVLYFIKLFAMKTDRQNLAISPAAMKLLIDYTWKENIKELKNVIERAVVLEERNFIDTHSLPFEINTKITNYLSLYDLDVVAKEDIQKVLKYTCGDKNETARLLNIGLGILNKKMDEYLIPL